MRKLSIFVLAFGLVVAACSGSSGEATTTSTASLTTSTGGATTTTPAAPTTTAPTETTTTPSSGGGSDCLVGTWILDSDEFVENFVSIFAVAGMPDAEVSALDGTFDVELSADGSLRAARDEWGFRIATAEGTFVIEVNGTESGTWSADGSTLTVNVESSDIDLQASVEVGGQVLVLPEGQVPVEPPEGIASDSEYSCTGDVLRLTNAGVESVLNRG